MEQLLLIPRVEEGSIIPQRLSDGYINATALCQSVNKRFHDYRVLKSTEAFINELGMQTQLNENQLIHIITGGNASYQGTWVHPYLAINLAQWLSPKFAVKVSQWVFEWQQAKEKPVLPVHISRYLLNRSKIPYNFFSMLNELTFNLVAPLEQAGYTLPEDMVPDISEGKMFCKWLRDNRNIEPKTFPSYQHEYPDGRVVSARLYPINLYEDFRQHFNEIWLPQRAIKYFHERDPRAIPLISTLLLPAP